ncbi:MAG: hypothetical protein HQK96_06900 [Nitrospirae bacterium]|nr:hypothetical protein [Nitrospirota bacterium]
MQAIWKFPLDPVLKQEIGVPKDSRILCVQNQNEVPVIWVLVPDVGASVLPTTIFVYVTGKQYEKIEGEYLGTVQLLKGGLVVVHVFVG